MALATGSSTGLPTDDVLDRLEALSTAFGDGLAEKVGEVRRIWSLVPGAPSAAEARSALLKIQDIVHALAGAGKSFGFPRVSAAAAPLDGLFRLLSEGELSLKPDEIAQIGLLIQGLETAICSPRELLDVGTLTRATGVGTGERTEESTVVILAQPGESEAEWVRDGLAAFGYSAHIVGDATAIPSAVLEGGPGVIYADISDGDERLALIRPTLALSRLPVILASSRTAFADRLDAVRKGASLFMARPFEIAALIDSLSALDEARYERPFRVVIAEDDRSLASFYQLTLDHAGMETRVVSQPSKLLDALSGFDADLILMDLYMSECTGLDLAQIVRQFPAYTTVPILFLSTESRLDLQLRARHLGADDFLPKPLQPGQLISAVTSRANRYRSLKKLTDRDSLTGLLNHTNILRCLEREMSVANRARQPVSFAMIDIDNFKGVNDTYGHATGDQVILRMTHLLRNRLRRVDYVGRYGGEEFAVVMPNTDAQGARAVVDQLRIAACEIAHACDQRTFSVTFSSGIASYPEYKTPVEIAHAADAALYAAKRAGRNQVLVAETGARTVTTPRAEAS